MIRKILFVVVLACIASVLASPSDEHLERARQDSSFREFEKFFDIDKIRIEDIQFCTSDRRGREEEFKSFLGGRVSKICTVTGYKYKIYGNGEVRE